MRELSTDSEPVVTGTTVNTVVINNTIENPAKGKPIKIIYLSDADREAVFFRQICIWLPIILGAILYFVIVALIEMPIQKNSILYANFGSSKTSQLNQ